MADSEGSRELIIQEELGYTSVKIFTAHPLGSGSYGAVYKARCDELSCAVKLLHSVLFQFNDPGVQITMQRFERECEVLSTTKHPCIVQYLGTAKDPETGRLVLLMELMDESLTKFLERSTGPLPYYIQVYLCHDISLALAYLHSKSIIHRDLSSNNVLLTAGSRAKVTDFGMAKLLDANLHTTPMTQCPGTAVYMPPEALTVPPKYTEKLDCFSAGVLTIQIVTREFPEPGPGFRVIQDQRYPTGKVHVPLPEVERRKNAINLIDEAHPLLPIALRCLKDDEKDRPQAREICHCLEELKELKQYHQSIQQSNNQQMEDEIRDLKQQVSLRDQEIEMKLKELEDKDLVIAIKERASERLMREVDKKNGEIEARSREIEAQNREIEAWCHEIEAQSREIKHLTRQLRTLEAKSRIDNDQICTTQRRDKRESLGSDRDRSASECASPTETIQQSTVKVCEDTLASHHQQELKPTQTATTTASLAAGKPPHISLRWRECEEASMMMVRGAAAVDGSRVYINPGNHYSVYAYDVQEEKWSSLADCPHRDSGFAVVNGLLTAVGGAVMVANTTEVTNALVSLVGTGKGRWLKRFPPMSTRRMLSATAATELYLVVAGGNARLQGDKMSSVEVMKISSKQWIKAINLPSPVSRMSMTLCGDVLYMLGGWIMETTKMQQVLTCSLTTLVQSCDPQSTLTPSDVWQCVADIPDYQSTCATLEGLLVSVGGCDDDWNPTDVVRRYDPTTNSWHVIGHMPTARYQSLVVMLPGNKLMVMGGYTTFEVSSETDVVEMASVVQ